MPDRQTTPAEQDAQVEKAILGMLLDHDAQRPWSVDEIAREIGDDNDTLDALARLHGAGLLHRCGEFAWATRAALAADAIGQ